MFQSRILSAPVGISQAKPAHRSAARPPRRAALVGAVVSGCLLHGLAAVTTAQDAKPRPEVLQSEGDRFPIHITYYPALEEKYPSGTEDAPVVILLHGEDGSRLIWDKSSAPPGGKSFAEVLNELGYAVVTVDLRKHGESVVDGATAKVELNDYGKMAQGDLMAVKDFLVAEHEAKRLNVRKLGIVASDVTAPVALAFAELDWKKLPYLDGPGGAPGTPRGQDVRAIVLLSPVASIGRLNGTRSATFLRKPQFGIAFLVMVGTRDAMDRNQAKSIYQVLAGIKANEDRVEFLRPNTNARGTVLLGTQIKAVEVPILEFLKENLMELDDEWATRKSRYDREPDDE
ncbi:MAG: hypothetical protein DWQ29_20560 [Planctomycetota bacterium]|nr:MAG: hypothetical protein DWQ29_20560 [Planctomycetota bacterium]